jgi:hypothetical protein
MNFAIGSTLNERILPLLSAVFDITAIRLGYVKPERRGRVRELISYPNDLSRIVTFIDSQDPIGALRGSALRYSIV